MQIGPKIKQLRNKLGLTQEELGQRTDLTKSFISQLERDLTSPSIATLTDILECLGTSLKDFFTDTSDQKIVFGPADTFENVDDEMGFAIRWLVSGAQKNMMEPIMLVLSPSGRTYEDEAHEGEEFGYVVSGSIALHIGAKRYRLKKGDSFYYTPWAAHYIENTGKRDAQILWVSAPPSF